MDVESVAQAVIKLARRLRQERQTGLSPTGISVLGTVRRLERSEPSVIAAYERVSQPSITRVLKQLGEEGYLVREPSPEDGRKVIISLSEEGARILAQERERRNVWLAKAMSELTTEEQDDLRRGIAVIEHLATL